jgi:prepilin-type N-terminal cleavage/methylation domain-containing protein
MKARRGLTLLETMVALVILGLVSLAYLELFGGAARSTASARQWSEGIAYAEEGMERLKLTSSSDETRVPEQLPDGFTRRVEASAWRENLQVVSIVVTFPSGGEFSLSRLMEAR